MIRHLAESSVGTVEVVEVKTWRRKLEKKNVHCQIIWDEVCSDDQIG